MPLRRVLSYRITIPLILVAMLGFVFVQGLKKDPTEIPSTVVGKTMPLMHLPSLAGVNIDEDMKGKVAFLNVWATWCETCISEHEVVKNIAEQTQVAVYGLSYHDEADSTRAFLKQRGNPYRDCWYDTTGNASMNLGITGTPDTYIIDKKGIIRYRHAGKLTTAEINNKILPLIKTLQEETGEIKAT